MQSSSKTRANDHGKPLLRLARRSIEHGLATGKPVSVTLQDFHSDLQRPGAAFVTLHKQQQLRGCIGNLTAHQPLVNDVADNAFSAAFRDPRFPAVEALELTELHVEISVLTPYEPLEVGSEAELLDLLQPQIDGIVLEEGHYRSTFLPAVWEQLPDKQQFLQHLKRKAGLPADYWSPSLKIYRYRTISYAE
ncbi:MAG: AmmeMemoRadiSam system protein A [Gammaproteobacteria bacterium]|nr:AmmeMemoRadiSam system protein A [Gammaproteobacteria bacterium]